MMNTKRFFTTSRSLLACALLIAGSGNHALAATDPICGFELPAKITHTRGGFCFSGDYCAEAMKFEKSIPPPLYGENEPMPMIMDSFSPQPQRGTPEQIAQRNKEINDQLARLEVLCKACTSNGKPMCVRR